jgi:hypothetical protein
MKNKYIVKQNPKNALWYVLGDFGKFWMPVSNGYENKEVAVRWMNGQHRADADARRLVSNALDRTKQLD